jgi:hypothetical protein
MISQSCGSVNGVRCGGMHTMSCLNTLSLYRIQTNDVLLHMRDLSFTLHLFTSTSHIPPISLYSMHFYCPQHHGHHVVMHHCGALIDSSVFEITQLICYTNLVVILHLKSE